MKNDQCVLVICFFSPNPQGLGWTLNTFVLAEKYFLFSHCLFGCILSIICCARKYGCVLCCVVVPLRSLQRWPEHSHVSFWRRWAPDGLLPCLRPAREPRNTISREDMNALCHGTLWLHQSTGTESMLKTAYRSEDVDVLVSGDQMGAFGNACSRLKLVPRQHPDLSRKTSKTR